LDEDAVFKLKLVPEPAGVPPHEPVNHFQLAPVPKDPPETDKDAVCPTHKVDVPDIEVAGFDVSLTVNVTVLQMVLLQAPSALKKYV